MPIGRSRSPSRRPIGIASTARQKFTNEPLTSTEHVIANAAQRNGVKNAIVNAAALKERERMRAFDLTMPAKLAPLDQESTGLCWAFSGLNVLRYNLVRRLKLRDDFAFSQTYVLFYHKLESANSFLRKYWKICVTEEAPERYLDTLRKHPITDGGHWGTFVELATKYGIVPSSEMPPTDVSRNTATLNFELRVLLRQAATELCRIKNADAMEAVVEKVMGRVHRLLVVCLGEPPKRFTWRYERSDGAVRRIENMTPLECFRRANEGLNAEGFWTLIHLPGQPEGTYNVRYLDSVYTENSRRTNRFFNVPDFDVFRGAVDESLNAGVAVFFASEFDQMRDGKTGLLHHALVDHTLLIGEAQWTKEKRVRASIPEVDHAMIIDGRQTGGGGCYRVQNSHGKGYDDDHEGEGFLGMTPEWMHNHVFSVSCPAHAVERAFSKARDAGAAARARTVWNAPRAQHTLDPWHFIGNVLRPVPS